MIHHVTRRCTLPVLVLLALCTGKAWPGTDLAVRAGVMKDMTDLDTGAGSTVVKSGATLSTDDIYRFNCTFVHNRDTGTRNATWYMFSAPDDRLFGIVLGNYNLHFGSGVVMGKKEFMQQDTFSRKIAFSREKIFTPSGSGSEVYSFLGSAMSFTLRSDESSAGIVPFFSVQRRYLTQEDTSGRRVSSSLATMNMKYSREGKNISPVDIINCGGAAEGKFMNLFTLQVYGLSTIVSVPGDGRITWSFDSGTGCGTDRISSYGVFAEYRDENISFFIEPACTLMSGTGWSDSGNCVAWGLALRNETFAMKLTGKNSGRSFLSVYASGDSGPEDVLEFSGSVSPCRYLDTGAAFYSEKDLAVNRGSDERKCFMREEASLSLKGLDLLSGDVKFSRKIPFNGETGRSRQVSTSAAIVPGSRLYLRGRYIGQYNSSGTSHLYSAEVKLLLLQYFSLGAGFTSVSASDDNALYAVLTPAAENTMDINRFVSDAKGYSVKLKFSRERDSFYFRFCRLDSIKGTEYNAESALVLVF